MPYFLKRVSDGAGDSGQMSDALRYNPATDEMDVIPNSKPTVGYAVRVGSYYGSTYRKYDFWTTTPVSEILEERDGYVKFKTTNSIYEWECI